MVFVYRISHLRQDLIPSPWSLLRSDQFGIFQENGSGLMLNAFITVSLMAVSQSYNKSRSRARARFNGQFPFMVLRDDEIGDT